MDRLREVWASLESRLHVQLPGLPEKAPRKAGLMERSRWLCFQHRHLQAGKGLLLDTSSKGRRPKVGGAFSGPKNQRIDPGCVITSNGFFGGVIF